MRLSLDLGLGSIATLNKGGGWSPLLLGADLLAWWTADDVSTMTLVGSQVSAWRDKKHGYEVVQGVSAARPVYGLTSFNGAPALTFDGTDDRLTAEQIFGFPSGALGGEIWSIVQQDALATDTSSRSAVSYGDGSAGGDRRLRRAVRSGVNRGNNLVGTGGATFTDLAGTVVNLSTRHVMRAPQTPTEAQIQVDGQAVATGGAVPNTVTTRFSIGATPGSLSSQHWQGKQRDVLITRPLSPEKLTLLQAWALPRRML